ncbi:hypothetical protein Golax_012065 [Gossypium laxum]|uniref:N-carbamoylputrescine amidase n=2 Tax=Gossypium TaxID=3633 RepID=A0A7J8ZMS4_9ROSI|nr:hypothetical protein [Gossypium laxum]
MQELAKELGVVLPVSFFEEANNAHYNSVAIIDADGTDLGLYRKSHIPDGPGYQEKFYFNPGDTGFKVAICWDQWYPEAARAMALQGAEILFYPTAIGSEPQDEGLDSREHWQRVMQGHAGANVVPLVASNRIGKEIIETEHGKSQITFYGNSFIAGPTGEIVAAANDKDEAVLIAQFDLDKIKSKRSCWGVFRDRRPDLYKNPNWAVEEEEEKKKRRGRKIPWGRFATKVRDPLTKIRVWLGTFNSAEEAARAYDVVAITLCGNKAKMNSLLIPPISLLWEWVVIIVETTKALSPTTTGYIRRATIMKIRK